MPRTPQNLTLLAALLSLLLISSFAHARTPHRRGAAHKPRQFAVQMPFPCGTDVRVNCAYGPGCSKAHRRVNSQTSTNDYYALDLARAEPGGGENKSVVAVASGTVRLAGWAKRGWAPYGKIVYIEHDFVDRGGKKYYSLYAHLAAVLVKEGQRVEGGTPVAHLGGSSRRHLHRFGPHLHFAIYRGSSPRLGGGQAVVPEPLGGYEDFQPRLRMTACELPEPAMAWLQEQDDSTMPLAAGGLTDPPAR